MRLYESKYWMRKSCPGLKSGLKAMSLLMMTFVVMAFSSTIQAQFHGAQIQKQCTTPVRNCVASDECPGGDQCIEAVCDTTLPRTTNCNIRATS